MSKKDLIRGGLDSLLTGSKSQAAKKAERPKPETAREKPSAMKAATFKYKPEHLEKLRTVAFFDKRLIQDIVAEALEDYFTKYEKAKGKIKTR